MNQYTCYSNIHTYRLYTAFQSIPTHCLQSRTFTEHFAPECIQSALSRTQTGPFNTAAII